MPERYVPGTEWCAYGYCAHGVERGDVPGMCCTLPYSATLKYDLLPPVWSRSLAGSFFLGPTNQEALVRISPCLLLLLKMSFFHS